MRWQNSSLESCNNGRHTDYGFVDQLKTSAIEATNDLLIGTSRRKILRSVGETNNKASEMTASLKTKTPTADKTKTPKVKK